MPTRTCGSAALLVAVGVSSPWLPRLIGACATRRRSLASIAESVCIVTETTAQAVFEVAEQTPGCTKAIPAALDGYRLARGLLAITVATNGFARPDINVPQVMSIAAVVATHLDILREQCAGAAAAIRRARPYQAAVFESASKGLAGTAAMLVASIKAFVKEPSQENRQSCLTFTKPVIASVECVIEFVKHNSWLDGTPPQMTRDVADYVKPIQAAALSVSSATTLMVGAIKSVLTNPGDQVAPSQVARYASAIDSALTELVQATKVARDAKIMFDPVGSATGKSTRK